MIDLLAARSTASLWPAIGDCAPSYLIYDLSRRRYAEVAREEAAACPQAHREREVPMKWRSVLAILVVAAIPAVQFAPTLAADKPYDGVMLNLASQNDQFAAVMADLVPRFKEETGITVKVDILSYPDLLTKVTSDFIGHTKGYDLLTMDIVWAGQFAQSGYTVELTDWIKRDAAEINADDIYPVLMSALGNYKGKQVAFPFAGYANV